MLMRMYERFSGCRVLSYCVMTNHFHLLLGVPPPPSDGEFGISEEELTYRPGGLYSRAYVTGVQAEILKARTIAEGKREHFSWLSRADQKKEMAYIDLNPVRAEAEGRSAKSTRIPQGPRRRDLESPRS